MAILKCKMCGGTLEVQEGMSVAECEYCGTTQTVPNVDDEKKITLFKRANKLRADCYFDQSAVVYESIVKDFPEEAEAYWGILLCTYGIEYVDDPATGKKIPTCHRSSFDSIMDDNNFELVMENADVVARKVYREEAKAIEEIRKGIIEISGKEEPYDIFICYKETDENSDRTIDSEIAQDVYDMLTDKGYRVFFARITLEDKLGQEYEPYIFAALNSAKLMLVFGTDYEYFNAVWVKNEWSRFLRLMGKDKTKALIPCYKNVDAYDMPKEFGRLQAQDMGKVGAMQDLMRGIEKLLDSKTSNAQKSAEQIQVVSNTKSMEADGLLKRAFIFLEDGDFIRADEYCEKVLDLDPENAYAYLGKLMAELKVNIKDNLQHCKQSFEYSDNYKKVLRFADENLQNELSNYIQIIKTRIKTEQEEKQRQRVERLRQEREKRRQDEEKRRIEYEKLCQEEEEEEKKQYKDLCDKWLPLINGADTVNNLLSLQKEILEIIPYSHSKEFSEKCSEKIYAIGKNSMSNATSEIDYRECIEIFSKILDYRDSRQLKEDCEKTIQLKKEQSIKEKEIAEIQSKINIMRESIAKEEKKGLFKSKKNIAFYENQICKLNNKIKEIEEPQKPKVWSVFKNVNL